jgi:hypothetical protein
MTMTRALIVAAMLGVLAGPTPGDGPPATAQPEGIVARVTVVGAGGGRFEVDGRTLLVTLGQPSGMLCRATEEMRLYPGFLGCIHVVSNPVGVAPETPLVTSLGASFPNPFNPATTIPFTLAEAGEVQIVIYDVRGERVHTLVREVRDPGHHRVVWNGRDQSGRPVASGVYVYRLVTTSHLAARKMLLIR